MPKKPSLKIKKMDGGDIFDTIKSAVNKATPVVSQVAKRAMPVALELGKAYAQKKIQEGGDILTDLAKQLVPMILSGGQIRKLKKGGAISISPSMISDTAETALKLLPASAQKIMKNLAQNKGIRYMLKQGEDLVNRVTGQGIFDSIKSVAKSAMPVVSSVAKEIAPIALDIGADYAKKRIAGKGMRRKPKMMGNGASAYISPQYKQAMKFLHTEGGSIYPAGGSIYPAGERMGGAVLQNENPVQLGSPYLSMHSPAMHPFFENGNPYRYAPLGKSKHGGNVGQDILSGLSTAAKFAPLLGLL